MTDTKITPVKAHIHKSHGAKNKKDTIRIISGNDSNFFIETKDYKFTVLGQKKDTFESSAKTDRKDDDDDNTKASSKKSKKTKGDQTKSAVTKKVIKGAVSVIMAVLSALGVYHSGAKILDGKATYAIVDFDPDTQTIDEMSEIYGVDKDVLLKCNNLDDEKDLEDTHELKIPSTYTYIDEAITSTTKELYRGKGDSETEQTKGDELDKLVQKDNEQEDISYSYTDGDYVYIKIKDFRENQDLAEKYGSYSLSSDYVMTLFDIKSGELQKYNSLDDKEVVYDTEGTLSGSRKDSDEAMVESGSVIKVPVSSIDTENIDLSNYTSTKTKSKSKDATEAPTEAPTEAATKAKN